MGSSIYPQTMASSYSQFGPMFLQVTHKPWSDLVTLPKSQ